MMHDNSQTVPQTAWETTAASNHECMSALWKWYSRLVRGMKREMVAEMASCWRPVSASACVVQIAAELTAKWLEQLHSATSQVTTCGCSCLKNELFRPFYNLGLEWSCYLKLFQPTQVLYASIVLPVAQNQTNYSALSSLTSSFRVQ